MRQARHLLIDETTLLHQLYLEALDRTLRDLMNKPKTPFGGKIIILAGDFRQCLPVVPGANRATIVDTCINRSHLWNHFQVHSLTENMRVMASGNKLLEQFDQWTLSLGNGTANDKEEKVTIQDDMITQISANTTVNKTVENTCMREFCQHVFPNMEKNLTDPRWLEGRAVLASTNSEVDTINDLMETMMPGASTQFF